MDRVWRYTEIEPHCQMSYQIGDRVAPLNGIVTETRDSRLGQEVQKAFKTVDFGSDLCCANLDFAPEVKLPNPLGVWSQLLCQHRNLNLSTIHGELNLENLLVTPETGFINLIDFADARTGHVLHNLLRLETELVTNGCHNFNLQLPTQSVYSGELTPK